MTSPQQQAKTVASKPVATTPAPALAAPKPVQAGDPLALKTFGQQQEAASNTAKVFKLKDDPAGLAQLLQQVLKSKMQSVAVSTSTLENIPEAGTVVKGTSQKVGRIGTAATIINPMLGVLVSGAAAMAPSATDKLVNKVLTPKATANLTTGSTRNLATMQGKEAVRNEMGGLGVVYSLLKSLNEFAKPRLPKVMTAYQKAAGRPLSTDIGELVRDPAARIQMLALLPPLFEEATLALDGFLEQLAVGMVYSDQTAEELNAEAKEDRRSSSPAQLLTSFGYKAGPPIYGRWGFQMRAFTPVAGKARWPHPIVAFRGTEGVQFDVSGQQAVKTARAKAGGNPTPAALAAAQHKGVEGSEDTLVGDFSSAEVGWLQYHPNAELIKTNLDHLKSYGKAYATGHSLGGALAQIVTAYHTSAIHQLVTFQAANVDQKTVELFKKNTKAENRTVATRQYRIDGDVVPTSGEAALPGEIFYFDRASRDKGSNKPFQSSVIESVSAGHVTPMLSTYIRQQDPKKGDLKTLAQYGMRDEATLNKKDGKTVKDVLVAFGGQYNVENDPRLVLEEQRVTVAKLMGHLPGKLSLFEQVFYQHIAYNTLLSHIEPLAKNSKDYDEFQKRVAKLLAIERLPMMKQELELAKALSIDSTLPLLHPTPVKLPMTNIPTPFITVEPIKTKFDDYKKNGVLIDKDAKNAINTRLKQLWLSWRSP